MKIISACEIQSSAPTVQFKSQATTGYYEKKIGCGNTMAYFIVDTSTIFLLLPLHDTSLPKWFRHEKESTHT